jgi:hypothetical protein
MAAPQVAGAVALLNVVKSNITVSEVKDAIFSSVDKMPELLGKVSTNGKLNIAASMFKVLGLQYQQIQAPIIKVYAPPVAKVGYLSLRRVSGWASSERSGASPVVVRVIINGRLVASQWANKPNHGFNIVLNKNWFRRGTNDIRLQVFDPVSKQITLVWVGRIRK